MDSPTVSVNITDTLVTDLTFGCVVEFAVAGPSIDADHTDGTSL